MSRTAAIFALAVLLAAPVAAQEGDIVLEYDEFTVAHPDAAAYWTDYLPKLFPDAAPATIHVASMPTAGGGSYTVTVLMAGGWCGMNDCPTRIFEDGRIIADFMACNLLEEHSISADGQSFYACGVSFDVEELRGQIVEFGAPF
jgi:hypothetical protein